MFSGKGDGAAGAKNCGDNSPVSPGFPSRFARRTWLILLIIVILAFLFRAVPAWTNAAWGNDFGVYYGLTNSFVKDLKIFNDYTGWGGSYQYFPVLYIIGGGIHIITGLSIERSLMYTGPLFGAFTSLFLYLITYELLRDKRIALLAAAFLAVNPLHLYTTSHAAPLTIGHFFMLLCIYLFLAYRRRKRFLIPLIISSVLLILSHHLSTYFYIITLIGIIFTGNLLSPKEGKKIFRELMYLLAFSAASFSYWLLVAGKYFNSFFESGAHLLPQMVVLLFYIWLVLLFLFTNVLKKRASKIPYPVYTGKYDTKIGLITISFILVGMSAGTLFITIPGTNSLLTWALVLTCVPLICTVAFVIIGFVYIAGMKVRDVIAGWLGIILISMAVAIITQNRILFPDRHFEYWMEPLSLIAAIGAYKFYQNGLKFRKNIQSGRQTVPKGKYFRNIFIVSPRTFKRFCVLMVFAVLISNGISSYPMRKSVGPFHEGFSPQFFSTVDWLDGNADKNLTIASQHPYSQYLYARGFKNVTYEDTGLNLWYSNNWTGCYNELNMTNETDLPRVEYILMDDVMRDTGVQARVGIIPMAIREFPLAWDKFMSPPFEMVYLNGTYELEGSFIEGNEWSGKWAAVFSVNWTYIEENMKKE